MSKRLLCIVCLDEFDETDMILAGDPDGICPLCGAPGPFLIVEEEE